MNLIDVQRFNIFGIYYTDFVFLVNIAIVIYQIIKDKFQINNNKSICFLLLFIGIAITSAIMGKQTYQQSFFSGLVAQREWISWMLLMYPVYKWIQKNKITVGEIKQCIIFYCDIYAIICILQYMLYNFVQFTYVTTNVRYGSTRLYFNTIFFCFAIAIVLDQIINKNQGMIKKIIKLIAYLFVVVVITKGRMQSISLLFAIMICIILRRDVPLRKKIMILVVAIVALILFFNTTMGQDIVNTIMGVNSENDTLSVRNSGREYYLALYNKSWKTILFGCGFANSHNEIATNILNPLWNDNGTARYYLEDVGIIAPLIRYGLIGIIIWGGIMIRNLLMSYKIYCRSGQMMYLQFLLMDIIASSTLIPTMFNTTILFPLLTIMILFEYKQLNLGGEKYEFCDGYIKL